jgi:hypothetical protein
VFLHNPTWEPTNNAAERGARSFRHGQHPHFRRRRVTSIEADLKVRAYLKKERSAGLRQSDCTFASAAGGRSPPEPTHHSADTSNVDSAVSKRAFILAEIHSTQCPQYRDKADNHEYDRGREPEGSEQPEGARLAGLLRSEPDPQLARTVLYKLVDFLATLRILLLRPGLLGSSERQRPVAGDCMMKSGLVMRADRWCRQA